MNKALAHIKEQQELLELEYNYEKSEYEVQSAKIPLSQKVRRGICWANITLIKNYYNSLNQFVVEIKRNSQETVEQHFEFGVSVIFFNQDIKGNIEQFKIPGSVSFACEDRMAIIINNPSAIPILEKAYNLGIQKTFNEQNYRNMFNALEQVYKAKNNRLSELRDIFLDDKNPTFRNITTCNLSWINKSQNKAINKILSAKDVAIVHGPPGTGKTTTLVEAINEVLHRETQVMVCTQSNMAVDWISEKLVDRGISVLRIGNPSKITDKMFSFTYEYQFQSHPKYNELWNIRKQIRIFQKNKKDNYKNRDKINQQIIKLRDRARDLQILIHNNVINNNRVIACTLSCSNHRELEGIHFSTLFIDEAAQALQAASWIAIAKADRVILAGDYYQLPPVIKSHPAANNNLEVTLMEYVAKKKPMCVSFLLTQYRMNEEIMKFSSSWFYENKLIADESVKNRNILNFDNPLVWVDTSYIQDKEYSMKEKFIGNSYGRINNGEAHILLKYFLTYVEKIGYKRIINENIDFGIISPYMNQVQLLRSMINGSKDLKQIRKRITVHTVDGFQGQERDIIFISLVRANEQGNIGFLSNLRRMNVAMTRAKMKLVMIGNSKTLAKNIFFKKLIQTCRNIKI